MNKKKWLSNIKYVLISLLLFNLLIINSVHAQSFDIRKGSNDLIRFFTDWGSPFVDAFLGGDNTGVYLFEKLLFFLLLVGLVYLSLSRLELFRDKTAILWTVAIIVPILSVRFMDFKWINTVLLTYQVFAVVMLGMIPFAIYFLFLINAFPNYATLRKIGWIFFIVVYYALWSTSAVNPSTQNHGYIFYWTMFAAFVVLLLDGTIARAMMRQKWNEADNSAAAKAIAFIDEDIYRYQHSSGLPTEVREREIRKLEKQRAHIRKRFHY